MVFVCWNCVELFLWLFVVYSTAICLFISDDVVFVLAPEWMVFVICVLFAQRSGV